MASRQSIAPKLGWLLACLAITGLACDDDKNAADEHAAEHTDHDDDTCGAAGAAASAGEHDSEHDTSVMVGPLTGAKCPDNSTLTYDNFGKQFFQNFCLGCHSTAVKCADRKGAPADHNFDMLADVELLAPHIDQYAGSGPDSTNTMMPPADAKPQPTKEDRQKLSEWLACGAKEN